MQQGTHLPVYFKAGQGLSRSTGGTFCQLAVTAPMILQQQVLCPRLSVCERRSLPACQRAACLTAQKQASWPRQRHSWRLPGPSSSRMCLAPSRSEFYLLSYST